ncbi:hypothetical protein M8818_007085 [Zalaria obscura]|uniref:Uncharacterized protein n=1 Tax=Zalaria obscura TaxID=2024903 RepID=A0ACC3S6Y9_9PEZI
MTRACLIGRETLEQESIYSKVEVEPGSVLGVEVDWRSALIDLLEVATKVLLILGAQCPLLTIVPSRPVLAGPYRPQKAQGELQMALMEHRPGSRARLEVRWHMMAEDVPV